MIHGPPASPSGRTRHPSRTASASSAGKNNSPRNLDPARTAAIRPARPAIPKPPQYNRPEFPPKIATAGKRAAVLLRSCADTPRATAPAPVSPASSLHETTAALQRTAVRQHAFFQPRQKYRIKLQALRAMQSHQRNRNRVVVLISIAGQRRRVQYVLQRLPLLRSLCHGVRQFAQVLAAGGVLQIVLLLHPVEIPRPRQHPPD